MNKKDTKKTTRIFNPYKHESIIRLHDPVSGLEGYIGIHNTALGPALGGTRIFPYKSKKAALKDVCKLSRAMTYKCAISGLKFGGGKGVIIANPESPSIKKVLRAYAEKIKKLGGKFYTGEDVGLNESEVQYMLKFSPFFIGKSHQAGDPSPYAAFSAFNAIQIALKYACKDPGLKHKRVAIKGVGKTGSELARLLYKKGAVITVADIDQKKILELQKELPGIKIASVKEIRELEGDIYSPCAMGDDIDKKAAAKMRVKIICGTANNQLASPEVAEILHKRKILFIPDYIANAGGLINVSAELWPGGYSKNKVLNKITQLKKSLAEILRLVKKTGKNPSFIANNLAHEFVARHA